jgi:hypothetical protein
MYAVTSSPQEYLDEQPDNGTVVLFLIEECRANTNERWGDYAGWDMYWFNDGSDTGCILITDIDGRVQPVYDFITREDVFTNAQLRTLEEDEHVIVDAPFGVRQRVLNTEADQPDYYFDLDQLLNAGQIDRWAEWKRRLVA